MNVRELNDSIQFGGGVKTRGIRTPWFALEWFRVHLSTGGNEEGEGAISRMCTPGWNGLLAALAGSSLTHKLKSGQVTTIQTPRIQRIQHHQFFAVTPEAQSALFVVVRAGRRGTRHQVKEVLGDQVSSVLIEQVAVRNQAVEPPVEVVHEHD